MRLAKLSAAFLFAASALTAAPALAQGVQGLGILALDPVADGNTVLTITSQGEVKVAPDVAVFSVGVTNMADTAEDAMRQNAAQMTRVIAELRRRGVATADMQTGRTSVQPVTNHESDYGYDSYTARLLAQSGAEAAAALAAEAGDEAAVDAASEAALGAAVVPGIRILGYRANNSLTVRQRNLTEYGALIDALIGAGANTVNGPNFILENSTPTLDEARRRAVAEARRRAELYASAAGMRVVRLVMIEEGRNSGLSSGYDENSFGFAQAVIAADAYTAATPASPGELTVRSSVNLMLELAPL